MCWYLPLLQVQWPSGCFSQCISEIWGSGLIAFSFLSQRNERIKGDNKQERVAGRVPTPPVLFIIGDVAPTAAKQGQTGPNRAGQTQIYQVTDKFL